MHGHALPHATGTTYATAGAVVLGGVAFAALPVDATSFGQAVIGALVVIAWISQRAKTKEVHTLVNEKSLAAEIRIDELERALRIERGSDEAPEGPRKPA